MSLQIYIDAYSGYKANERPEAFTVEQVYEIAAVLDQWYEPSATYFKVQSNEFTFQQQEVVNAPAHCSRLTSAHASPPIRTDSAEGPVIVSFIDSVIIDEEQLLKTEDCLNAVLFDQVLIGCQEIDTRSAHR
jgi:hypothetical protein